MKSRNRAASGQGSLWPDDTALLPLFSGSPIRAKAAPFFPVQSASQGTFAPRVVASKAVFLSEEEEAALWRHDHEDPIDSIPDRVYDAMIASMDYAEWEGANRDEESDTDMSLDDDGNWLALSEEDEIGERQKVLAYYTYENLENLKRKRAQDGF